MCRTCTLSNDKELDISSNNLIRIHHKGFLLGIKKLHLKFSLVLYGTMFNFYIQASPTLEILKLDVLRIKNFNTT